MISRCLLIAKQKETPLRIIGKYFACPLAVFKVRLECVASVNVWYKVHCLAVNDTELGYCTGFILISVKYLLEVRGIITFLSMCVFMGCFLDNFQTFKGKMRMTFPSPYEQNPSRIVKSPLFKKVFVGFILIFIYRWKVDGRDINTVSDPNYSLIEGNLLINNPHVINHGGVYQCIATNTFGTVVSREAKVQFACEFMLGSCAVHTVKNDEIVFFSFALL